jgi:hypothetical protein
MCCGSWPGRRKERSILVGFVSLSVADLGTLAALRQKRQLRGPFLLRLLVPPDGPLRVGQSLRDSYTGLGWIIARSSGSSESVSEDARQLRLMVVEREPVLRG